MNSKEVSKYLRGFVVNLFFFFLFSYCSFAEVNSLKYISIIFLLIIIIRIAFDIIVAIDLLNWAVNVHAFYPIVLEGYRAKLKEVKIHKEFASQMIYNHKKLIEDPSNNQTRKDLDNIITYYQKDIKDLENEEIQ